MPKGDSMGLGKVKTDASGGNSWTSNDRAKKAAKKIRRREGKKACEDW